VEEAAAALRAHAEARPRELVVVCLSHFYNMRRAHHGELLRRLEEGLGAARMVPRACMAGAPACSLPLGRAWAEGWSFVVVYRKAADLVKARPHVWYGSMLRSPWPNTTSAPVLRARLEERMARGLPRDVLYVTQGVLTPRANTIAAGELLGRLGVNSLPKLAMKATPRVVEWLQSPSWRAEPLNIVVVDHYHRTDFVRVVVEENLRRLAALEEEQQEDGQQQQARAAARRQLA